MRDSAAPPQALSHLMTIVGAIATGIGLGGFLVGITEPVNTTRASRHEAKPSNAAAALAPSYREIDSAVVGPNAGWNSQFASLRQERPGLFDPVIRTPAMKDAALRDRLRTRAFDGAPPVIPHPVEQQSSASCLVCHQQGLKLGGRIATKVSHPHYSNCLQCHVEQAGGLPVIADPADAPWPTNQFSGVLRSGPGSRAMPGAPPMIPHSLQLRGDCMSCHGLVARPGLRTTHPWLQNCVQCHVADGSAERPRRVEFVPSAGGLP